MLSADEINVSVVSPYTYDVQDQFRAALRVGDPHFERFFLAPQNSSFAINPLGIGIVCLSILSHLEMLALEHQEDRILSVTKTQHTRIVVAAFSPSPHPRWRKSDGQP